MFSSRFHWDLQPNRLTGLLAAKRGRGTRILDLTQSNPTRAGIEYPEELRRVFDDPGVLRYDPAPAGSLAPAALPTVYYHPGDRRLALALAGDLGLGTSQVVQSAGGSRGLTVVIPA